MQMLIASDSDSDPKRHRNHLVFSVKIKAVSVLRRYEGRSSVVRQVVAGSLPRNTSISEGALSRTGQTITATTTLLQALDLEISRDDADAP